MKAIRVHQYGGGDALKYEDIPVPEPGAGEARVRIEAAGVNYIDVYQRTGLYQLKLPFTLRMEAAGVTEVKKDDRVAYSMISGAFAEYAIVPAARLVPLPHNIDSATGAATMLQGMTAHYLTHSTYALSIL